MCDKFIKYLSGHYDNLPVVKPKEVSDFPILYSGTITSLLNEKRSYVQQEMRKMAIKYMQRNNGELPSVELIKSIMDRTIPLKNNKKNCDIVVWWVDKMMPKFVANATKVFTESERHYKIIDQCTHEFNGEIVAHMPPSCEAFGVIVYENCHSKSINEYKLKESRRMIIIMYFWMSGRNLSLCGLYLTPDKQL